jgi:hypothetical protein
MVDNNRRSAPRGTRLDPKTAQAYTELLVETIWFKQIERAEEMLGAHRAHHFLGAIEEHVVDKLDARLQLQGDQS